MPEPTAIFPFNNVSVPGNPTHGDKAKDTGGWRNIETEKKDKKSRGQ